VSNVDRIREIIGKNTEPSNNDRINHIRSILKKPESEPETNTLSRLAKMPIAGVANAVETMVNVPASILNLMVPIVSERLNKAIPKDSKWHNNPMLLTELSEDAFINPSYDKTDLITKGVAKVLGEDLKPKTAAEEIAYGAGEFAVPIPGLGVASKGGKIIKGVVSKGKELAKKMGSHLGESVGLSAAIHGTPRIAEEGTGAAIAEDLVKGAAFGAGKSLIKPKETAAKISTLSSKPSEEVLKTANKYNIDLPVNVGLNSSQLNAATNVLKHSPFSADKFKQSFSKANQQTLDAIKSQIDNLGPDVVPSVASADFNAFLKSQREEAKKVANSLYDESKKHLKETDVVSIDNTKKVFDDSREIFNRKFQSPATKKVAREFAKIAESLGVDVEQLKLPKGWQGSDLPKKEIDKILNSIGQQSKKAKVSDLIGLREELNKSIKWNEFEGMENWLKSLKKAVDSDIKTSTNKKFIDSRAVADKFYTEQYKNRFKNDLTRSVLTGEAPTYVFDTLKDANSVNVLEKVAGNSPQAKQVVNALKKAKAREVFNNAFKEEGLHAGNYSKIFNKNETNQEYLKSLLGNKTYKNLKELSRITSATSKAGQEMLNTSSTAYTQQYMNTLSKLGSGAAGAIMLSVGAFKTLGAGAGTVAANKYLSKLLVDEEYVRLARQFALQNARGKPQFSTFKNLTNRASIILRSDMDKKEESN
jgi:hypothetical protein